MSANRLACVLVALASSCNRSAPEVRQGESAQGSVKQSGIDLEGIDPSVAPGDDFFGYANGTWVKKTEIPPDRSSWGAGSMLTELTTKRTLDLIEEAAKSQPPKGSDAAKVGDFYASYMDEAGIESKGLAPIEPMLRAVAAIPDAKGLAQYLGTTLRADVDVLNSTNLYTDNILGLWVAQDLDDPSHYSPFLLQGGLGMPDRDYYLDDSPHMNEIRGKYREHIAKVLGLARIPEAEAKAQRIFDLERRIAQAHATRIDSEDVQKGNNHWKREEFETKAPGLDWQSYFSAAGLDGQSTFVVWQPSAVTGIAALISSQPVDVWKEYLTLRAIEHVGGLLPKAFVDERFAFYGTTLAGTPRLPERWKRAVAATDGALGEVVGKLYVARYFPPAEKARAEEMVHNVIAAFSRRIDALAWMAPETKAKAKAKLAVLKVGIGYPDKWRDYSGLTIVRGDAMGNALRASRFDYQHSLRKLSGPVDRGEWVMNPQLVNAVNLPALNAMNFPAAILQPPYFDPDRPALMDYGATGAVIGHEISHSFDDQGALFDDKGRLHNWWTEADFAHFKASSEQLVEQYDRYFPFPDLHVNGKQTVSENIADVAGLSAAYDAYRLSLGGKEAPKVQGFTGDQQFFLSFAQSWRDKLRERALRQRIVVDGHAPDEYRADTVRNLDPWYDAFSVKPGQKLYLAPPERVRIW
ncbi:MAG: M13 family metallopeptidase [Myxococcales bacterium]